MRSPRSLTSALHPLAARRLAAYGIDVACYLGVAAATVPLGLVARHRWPIMPEPVVHALGTIPPIVAAAWAACAEQSATGATPGKRRMGLRVCTDDGTRLTASQAGARAAAKVLVPWLAGHTVTIHAVHRGERGPDALVWGSGVLAYGAVALGLAQTVLEPGRPLHDRLAGSRVGHAAAG